MKKVIIANWKSNPNRLSSAVELARKSDFKGAIIAPPHVYLEAVGGTLKRASLASQDLFWKDGGPYTGEISASQVKNLKVKYVIIGHSERRGYLNETDEMINGKVKMALSAGIKVILCVGENKEIRNKGVSAAKKFIKTQLNKDLKGIPRRVANGIMVAYEPIWAIGTGKSDTPDKAEEVTSYIKSVLAKEHRVKRPVVLYGGSVNEKNVSSFLKKMDIDGALVGGASLKPKSFKKIIEAR